MSIIFIGLVKVVVSAFTSQAKPET